MLDQRAHAIKIIVEAIGRDNRLQLTSLAMTMTIATTSCSTSPNCNSKLLPTLTKKEANMNKNAHVCLKEIVITSGGSDELTKISSVETNPLIIPTTKHTQV